MTAVRFIMVQVQVAIAYRWMHSLRDALTFQIWSNRRSMCTYAITHCCGHGLD
jgi:hypothetical protein